MSFALTTDQRDLLEVARAFLADVYPTERAARSSDSTEGWDPDSWVQLVEMGWIGVALPEERGGAGFGHVEETILVEELARCLYAGPFLSTVLALPALEAADAADALAGRSRWSFEVDGLVPDLDRVDRVLSAAGAVDATGDLLATVDPTRHVGRLAGSAGGTTADVDRAQLLTYLAAESLGVAEAALEIAVGYAKERTQFGAVIGKLQGIQHPLADTFTDLMVGRSLVQAAAWRLDARPDDALRSATMAKAFLGDAAVVATERAIQVHGGIGFTWEHPLHRYYKRAVWLQAFGGNAAAQRALIREELAPIDQVVSGA
ncbi:acyl-CoA dehydrogenase family protein [Nocardioides marmotae]|nr:acyl-CoA dehydrogenase family protein [Nocardioides marmotae]QKE00084.1 acyl-CoA/acyl-ACP dehydrogenase [Nocardioides marmotae]